VTFRSPQSVVSERPLTVQRRNRESTAVDPSAARNGGVSQIKRHAGDQIRTLYFDDQALGDCVRAYDHVHRGRGSRAKDRIDRPIAQDSMAQTSSGSWAGCKSPRWSKSAAHLNPRGRDRCPQPKIRHPGFQRGGKANRSKRCLSNVPRCTNPATADLVTSFVDTESTSHGSSTQQSLASRLRQ